MCSGEQQSDPPYMFTKIHLHYRVKGEVNTEKLERAIKLSEDKYCSVIASLRPGVPITSSYEVMR
jgi:putative redox protein